MIKKFIAGLGGAIALNLIHEIVRKTDAHAPHVNELGEEALEKGLRRINRKINNPEHRNLATLGADVASNTLYYAATATTAAAPLSGMVAGVATLLLPKYVGLNPAPVNASPKKKALTIGYYLAGAMICRYIFRKLDRKVN
ncbi:hypothetical protein ABDK00_008420 [Niabella insulamsoli]|uniref:hypothetical protein n=1 Tax=Niabella insulamsoli TaxID=3144874 RepID=UPI0031FD66E6